MKLLSRENTKLAVVAAVCIGVSTAGPSLAAAVATTVSNSDRVDGFHAVGFFSGSSTRAGKLVATNATTGLLPNNIIAKVPDSNLLDGMDSSAFLPATGTAVNSAALSGQAIGRVKRQWVGVLQDGTVAGKSTDLTHLTVTHPDTGTYCVDVGRTYKQYSVVGVVQSHVNGFEDLGLTVTSFYNTSQCPGVMRIYTTLGGAVSDQAFTLTFNLG